MLDEPGVEVRHRFGDYDGVAAPRRVTPHHHRRRRGMTLPFRPHAARRAARASAARDRRRSIPALEPAFVPSPAREAALARLREPGALAVTSGQQPGLFTGPLYTIHKALSTAALARVLERRWGRPVVPIFWLAGDDHDFAEASDASWLTADGALATASLPPRPPEAPLTPMYREPLGDGVDGGARRARGEPAPVRVPGRHRWSGCAGTTGPRRRSPAPSPARWPSCSRRPASSASTARHPAAKRAAAPLILRALERAAEIDDDLERQAEALGETAGPRAWSSATAPRS